MIYLNIKSIALLIATIAGAIGYSASLHAQQSELKVDEVGEGLIIALGGKLYDNLWVMIEVEPPNHRNPLFPEQVTLPAKDTWRCVSCHGWDYNGATGERAALGQHAAFHSLKHLAGINPDQIAGKIRGPAHGFPEAAFPDLIAEMLALFISAGQYDRNALFNAEGQASGDLKRGRDIFEGACINCHRVDGRADLTGETGDRSSLGWVARNRPEQALHKIRNGVPGAEMLAVGFLEHSQIRDLMAYLQALDPDEK